ncbi:uncharacterized protein [Macrobrachium rosenbergii]|uniref:uncharacterized protein isoform X2 n=1 Tax=Macrobrachium rosenbergii TaxID=79674 RepID=UPI0034D5C978
MKGIGYYLAIAITALLFIRGTESAAQLFRVRRSIRVCTPRDVARIGHFMCKRSVLPTEGQDGGNVRPDERSLEHQERSKDSNTFSRAESSGRDAFWEESPEHAFHDIYPFLEFKRVTYYEGSGQIDGRYFDGSGHTEGSYFGGSGQIEGSYSDGSGLIDGSYFDGSGQIDGSYFDGSGQIDGSYFDGRGHIDDSLTERKLQKRSNKWPRKFETIADIRKYCCHHDCPIELFLAECA